MKARWWILIFLTLIIGFRRLRSYEDRQFYHLEQMNLEMTIWGDYIIFEHYNSWFPPKTNYVKFNKCDFDMCFVDTTSFIVWTGYEGSVDYNLDKYEIIELYQGDEKPFREYVNRIKEIDYPYKLYHIGANFEMGRHNPEFEIYQADSVSIRYDYYHYWFDFVCHIGTFKM